MRSRPPGPAAREQPTGSRRGRQVLGTTRSRSARDERLPQHPHCSVEAQSDFRPVGHPSARVAAYARRVLHPAPASCEKRRRRADGRMQMVL
jgi:hypothetical protein